MPRTPLALTRRALVGALAAAGLAPRAYAQAPEKTVKFILPNATGSGVDAITRSAQAALGKALGHPVIVENQAGAGGIVGVQALTPSGAARVSACTPTASRSAWCRTTSSSSRASTRRCPSTWPAT